MMFVNFTVLLVCLLFTIASSEWKRSYGCYGSAGDCIDYHLTCSTSERILLGELSNEFRDDIKCAQGVSHCANDPTSDRKRCCNPQNTGCKTDFSKTERWDVVSQCSGRYMCWNQVIRSERPPSDCALSFSKVSSYAEVNYKCIQNETIANMCEAGERSGRSVYVLFNSTQAGNFEKSSSCSCVASSTDNIIINAVDIRIPTAKPIQFRITDTGSGLLKELPDDNIDYKCNHDWYCMWNKSIYVDTNKATLTLRGLMHAVPETLVWIEISSTHTIRLQCGTEYDIEEDSLESHTRADFAGVIGGVILSILFLCALLLMSYVLHKRNQNKNEPSKASPSRNGNPYSGDVTAVQNESDTSVYNYITLPEDMDTQNDLDSADGYNKIDRYPQNAHDPRYGRLQSPNPGIVTTVDGSNSQVDRTDDYSHIDTNPETTKFSDYQDELAGDGYSHIGTDSSSPEQKDGAEKDGYYILQSDPTEPAVNSEGDATSHIGINSNHGAAEFGEPPSVDTDGYCHTATHPNNDVTS